MHALLAIVAETGQKSVRNRLKIRSQTSFGLILEICFKVPCWTPQFYHCYSG